MLIKMKKKTYSTNKHIRKLVSRLINLRRHAVTEDSSLALKILKEYINMNVIKIKSGTNCWDWKIPPKWNLVEATIKFRGKKIFSHKDHVMAVQPYCNSFKGKVSLEELKKHINFSKKKPHAYAYNCVLAYRYPYQKDWLISMPYNKVKKLRKGMYEIDIRTTFKKGIMEIGEYTIKGKSKDTIILLSIFVPA